MRSNVDDGSRAIVNNVGKIIGAYNCDDIVMLVENQSRSTQQEKKLGIYDQINEVVVSKFNRKKQANLGTIEAIPLAAEERERGIMYENKQITQWK